MALVVRFSTPDGWRQNAQPFQPRLGAPKLLGPTVGQRRPIDSTTLEAPQRRTQSIPGCYRAICQVAGGWTYQDVLGRLSSVEIQASTRDGSSEADLLTGRPVCSRPGGTALRAS